MQHERAFHDSILTDNFREIQSINNQYQLNFAASSEQSKMKGEVEKQQTKYTNIKWKQHDRGWCSGQAKNTHIHTQHKNTVKENKTKASGIQSKLRVIESSPQSKRALKSQWRKATRRHRIHIHQIHKRINFLNSYCTSSTEQRSSYYHALYRPCKLQISSTSPRKGQRAAIPLRKKNRTHNEKKENRRNKRTTVRRVT